MNSSGAVKYYEAEVINAQDYSPFGMEMPERKWNSAYRYGFNGQEKSTEINSSGNSLTSEFWQYDARLGIRWNMDPKPNVSISPYNAFAGNPIWFSDPHGDTIILSSAFQKNDVWMKRYRTFIQTKEGKEFLKDYGTGGKYEKVAITLNVKELYWYRGNTEAFSVNPKNIADSKEIFDGGDGRIPKLRKGDDLKATLNFNWDRIDEKESKEDPLYKKNSMSRITGGRTILHETQHLRVITSRVLDMKQNTLSPDQQHTMMKDPNKVFYNDRLNYMYQYSSYYMKEYGKNWLNQIKNEVNEFDN